MDEIIIRKAKREDCKAIRNLIQELADFENMSNEPKIDCTILETDGFDTEHPLFICYVAETNKHIIGYTILYYTYSTWYGKAMYLEDLYIIPNYRGKHIGSRLLKTIAKEAIDNNCCRLDFSVLEWNPAQEFYKNKGAINITAKEGWHHYRFSDDNFSYLFSPSEPLFIDDAVSKISIPEEPLKEEDTFIEDDSDLLSHNQMCWEENTYISYEIISDLTSIATDTSFNVILDEQANIIVEDEELKRKRHQAKLLQRRDTLMQLDPTGELALIESISSEELLIEITPEMEEPEYMKNFYTKLILQSRNIYMDQHLNNPGFFSVVLLTDEYDKAFNTLINFIHESYINYSFEKAESLSEFTHFSKVAFTTMINPIVNEIKESLSTSILKKKTLLRMYGVNSWKDLMPSQKSSINIDN